ncbi:MAG: Dps family protein [Bacteroidota bacterium]
MDIEIGIDKKQREKISEGLSRLLADSYMLYLKSHNYHWNVTGTLFHPLHEMFEEQYTELAEAVDEIAERIRALGSHAPGSFREFSELTSIKEETDEPDAMEMIKRATEAHEAVIRTARAALEACEEAGDEASLDLITQRLHTHSKAAWMLRSHLE